MVKPPGHADHRLMGQITGDFHADVAAREVIVIEAVDRHAIRRGSELIYGGGRDQERVPDREGLRQVVETALHGVQKVLAENP